MDFNRTQLNKLLIHTLEELGYHDSAKTLQHECGGVQLESSVVKRLFQYIDLDKYQFITLELLCNLPLRNSDNSLLVENYHILNTNHKLSTSSGNNVDSMKIANILDQNEDMLLRNELDCDTQNDLFEVVEALGIQFDLFYRFYQLIKSNYNLCLQFKNIIQIMISIIRHFFIGLITKNIISAIQFLRNTFRKFIQLWESVLTDLLDWDIYLNKSVSIANVEEFDRLSSSPECFLRELSALLTIPKAEVYNDENYCGIYNDIPDSSVAAERRYSKETLINEISRYINPDELIPASRLMTLLKQAIRYQKQKNVFNVLDDEDIDNGSDNIFASYNTVDYMKVQDAANARKTSQEGKVMTTPRFNSSTVYSSGPNDLIKYGLYCKNYDDNVSLLQDNISSHENFRLVQYKTLTQNEDEIWYLQFSPDGNYLASATSDSLTDRKVLVYDTNNNFEVYKVLSGSSQSILYLAFSPDSRYLVTCPFNETACIYDIHEKGEPTLLNAENSNLVAEIISPMDSFEISKASKFRKHRHSHHNSMRSNATAATVAAVPTTTTSSESINSSESSPSLESASNNFSSSYARNIGENHISTSPRIWCCDWFHTSKHSGKFIMGSPDREVVIYDMDTNCVIFSLSEFINQETINKAHNASSSETNSLILDSRLDSNNSFETIATSANKISVFPRIHDLKISYDDEFLILMTHNGVIEVYNISNLPDNTSLIRTNYGSINEFYPKIISRLDIEKNLTSISLPQPSFKDSKVDSSIANTLLVNLQSNEIQLWNFKENILLQKFFGQKQEQFIIRSCFGYNNRIIVSGSEDGKVFLWDRCRGNILGVLPGHSMDRPSLRKNKNFGRNCNVVAWNPKDKYVFASGGDDGYVKIWKIIKE